MVFTRIFQALRETLQPFEVDFTLTERELESDLRYGRPTSGFDDP